ncbi:unnamed protein product [Mesocestoides corti]|uniref:Uncharacterized protein n=2 Tax=Mesocestoides corti TaxID=53468 RepID=A0A0R3UIN3_MESCO|nr:unnamed protein product [Mesocestoides corti]
MPESGETGPAFTQPHTSAFRRYRSEVAQWRWWVGARLDECMRYHHDRNSDASPCAGVGSRLAALNWSAWVHLGEPVYAGGYRLLPRNSHNSFGSRPLGGALTTVQPRMIGCCADAHL